MSEFQILNYFTHVCISIKHSRMYSFESFQSFGSNKSHFVYWITRRIYLISHFKMIDCASYIHSICASNERERKWTETYSKGSTSSFFKISKRTHLAEFWCIALHLTFLFDLSAPPQTKDWPGNNEKFMGLAAKKNFIRKIFFIYCLCFCFGRSFSTIGFCLMECIFL